MTDRIQQRSGGNQVVLPQHVTHILTFFQSDAVEELSGSVFSPNGLWSTLQTADRWSSVTEYFNSATVLQCVIHYIYLTALVTLQTKCLHMKHKSKMAEECPSQLPVVVWYRGVEYFPLHLSHLYTAGVFKVSVLISCCFKGLRPPPSSQVPDPEPGPDCSPESGPEAHQPRQSWTCRSDRKHQLSCPTAAVSWFWPSSPAVWHTCIYISVFVTFILIPLFIYFSV